MRLVFLLAIIITIGANTSYALAETALQKAQDGANRLSGYELGDTPSPSRDYLVSYISPLLQIAFSVLGVYFLVLFVYGGYIWFIARGNSSEADKAISIMKSAAIGMVIIFSSYAIASFVLNLAFRGTNQLQ